MAGKRHQLFSGFPDHGLRAGPTRHGTAESRFTVTLTDANNDEATVMIRLRIALKRLLRAYGLRCTSIAEDKGAPEAKSDAPQAMPELRDE
jgi:hypothetical protein